MAAGYLEAFDGGGGGGGILDLASSNTCTVCAVCSGVAAANGPELDNQASRLDFHRGGRLVSLGIGPASATVMCVDKAADGVGRSAEEHGGDGCLC
ncbi:hypothetical protein GE21DRAFT_1926 [Neurospora crassa]|uniref:Uncharacterized protein n=2 Tax=Neurospora crassa TaxID=5141 RepID=Q7SFU7_NEUCR|nr:hypothetical protein NCU00783 [Neurospora crassa OR74A]EAA35703.1 hypothetical protein NCU00783 [Neurospora crassa OR74A]KHE83720.1 hypothetical protein GE21DRAFT_1926 [Neurospora crassa]CAE81934.1 hypothetical protein [Neurospora crassa]|eukprot:XP_964939.1 hypothetical protein NCU00783 [Neurospora crassa OR74A]